MNRCALRVGNRYAVDRTTRGRRAALGNATRAERDREVWRDEAIRLRRIGYTIQEIAHAVHRSVETVHRLVVDCERAVPTVAFVASIAGVSNPAFKMLSEEHA